MTPYATFEDYADRYDADTADALRVSTLIDDASALVASMLPAGAEPHEGLLKSTVCAMVSRSVAASGMGGVSDYSEGAVGFSASVKFANPNGDLYLTSQEKDALGIGRGSVASLDMAAAR